MVDTLITVKKLFKANFTQMNRHETFFKFFTLEILKKDNRHLRAGLPVVKVQYLYDITYS